MKHARRIGWLLAVGLLAAGCASPTENGATAAATEPATLRILLHDQPAGVDEVWVEVDEVSVRDAAGDLHVVSAGVGALDLLSLQHGTVADLGLTELAAGAYDQVRLVVSRAWVVVDGEEQPLTVPSGGASGLKLNVGFRMPECGEVTMTLDWEVGGHLHDAPGRGWILRPVLRLESLTTDGPCGGPQLDSNGDGYSDLVIGRGTEFGHAYEFLGSAGGVAVTPSNTISWDVGALGYDHPSFFSHGLALGDLDGDGHGDALLATGTPQRARIHRGAAAGLDPVPSEVITLPPSPWAGHAGRGIPSVTLGDLDGDGVDDLVLAANLIVYAYRGDGAGGFASSPTWSLTSPAYAPPWPADLFGQTVAAGDLDGDGDDELVVGASREPTSFVGRVYVFDGTPAGPAPAPRVLSPPIVHPWRTFFGTSVAVDDFDADGFADVVVAAASQYTNSDGQIYVWPGSASGVDLADYSVRRGDDFGTSHLGIEIAPIGDFDGDGFPDLGAVDVDNEIYLFGGSPTGLSTAPFTAFDSPPRVLGIGYINTPRLAGVGDLNGDGLHDLAIGQPVGGDPSPRDGATYRGTAWVLYGRVGGGVAGPDVVLVPPPPSPLHTRPRDDASFGSQILQGYVPTSAR